MYVRQMKTADVQISKKKQKKTTKKKLAQRDTRVHKIHTML